MTRMIPDSCAEEAPPGEHDLFEKLRSAPATEDWVAFHSLNIACHSSQVEGEADFVVIVPGRGVLVIEVKSHERVETDGAGRWKLGNHEWKTKSPFDQASGSMHSVVEFLDSRGANAIGYPIWYCVWFTSVSKDRMPQSIGWQQWALLDASDLHAASVGTAIVRVLERASQHLLDSSSVYRRIVGTPNAAHIERMTHLLEPKFVTEMTVKEAARRRAYELEKYTAEQVKVLDMLRQVPRLIVDGPAGSGKTVLAVEAARRAAAAGKRVLFVVFNRLIEAELKVRCDGVHVYRLHALFAELAGTPIPGDADSDWYARLPERAYAATFDDAPRYDMIVIDEAQDIAKDEYLDVLDLLIVGGLKNGNIVVVGDFDFQNVYVKPELGDVSTSPTKAVFQRVIPTAMPLHLSINIRNTPELGEFFELLTGRERIYSEFKRADDDQVSVHAFEYSDAADQDALLARAVEQILSEPFTVRDIVILSPIRQSAARLAAEPTLRSRLGAGIVDSRLIRWGTIHEFKGMEAPAVILTDIVPTNRHLESLLYVGITRATDRLIVLRSKS